MSFWQTLLWTRFFLFFFLFFKSWFWMIIGLKRKSDKRRRGEKTNIFFWTKVVYKLRKTFAKYLRHLWMRPHNHQKIPPAIFASTAIKHDKNTNRKKHIIDNKDKFDIKMKTWIKSKFKTQTRTEKVHLQT